MAYDGVLSSTYDQDKDLKERLEKRLQGLRAVRQDIERDWMEVARFCQPRLSGYLQTYGDQAMGATQSMTLKRSKLNNKLLDAHAVWATGVLANGMTSGLSSPSRPWFTLQTTDPDLKEFKPVREWLDAVRQRILDFFARTNFYQAIKSTYLENGIFGTEAGVMLDHWRHGGVTYALQAGEYWIGLDDAGLVESLYRRCDMTALQILQRFGEAATPQRVKQAYTQKNYDASWEVYHAIERNDLRRVGLVDSRNKQYRSAYFMCGDGDARDYPLLALEGFNDQPFWAARWDVSGMEPYGYSPGMNAYADARQLQFQSLRKQQAIDYLIKPPLRGPTFLANQNINLLPGRITTVPGVDKDVFAPIWQIQPNAIEALSEDVMTTKQAIDRSFYVDLFLAITNMPGVQPKTVEEIARRNEEKLTQLGPVVERVNTEKLKICIDRAFLILLRQGLIPPPPKELQGQELKIEFISILTQLQRLVGLGSIERGVAFVGNIVGVFPEAGDKLDVDQAIDEYFDIAGTPASMIRSDEQVRQLRDSRAQAKAQEQAAAAAIGGASAAKDAAQAAQIMSQTDAGAGTQNLLQRVLGQPG